MQFAEGTYCTDHKFESKKHVGASASSIFLGQEDAVRLLALGC